MTKKTTWDKTKKKKAKKKGWYINHCDTLMSKITRSKGICELAGKDNVRCNGVLQNMHIITRSNKRLMFDPMNLLCGCAGHHMYYTHHPWEWVKLIKKHFPKRYKYIEKHREEIKKMTIDDYRELKKTLQRQLDGLDV